ncbi:MAG: hypothetical protein AVDCRST_MAG79-1325, partial [uncultured Thermoleophilia bacterium]
PPARAPPRPGRGRDRPRGQLPHLENRRPRAATEHARRRRPHDRDGRSLGVADWSGSARPTRRWWAPV